MNTIAKIIEIEIAPWAGVAGLHLSNGFTAEIPISDLLRADGPTKGCFVLYDTNNIDCRHSTDAYAEFYEWQKTQEKLASCRTCRCIRDCAE